MSIEPIEPSAEVSQSESLEPAADFELLPSPRQKDIQYVETPAELTAAVSQLRNFVGWFAIDAERASGFRYSQRAYLIQIKRGESPIFLIDPVAISSDVVTDPFIELAVLLAEDTWILHAATQDLPCLNEIGLYPTSLFDTELAGRIAGLPRVGLGAMVERFLQVKLAKEHSAVDWSTRPLAAEWLNYAALDVDVLDDLANGIRAELDSQNKLHFAQQEFDHLLHFRAKPSKVERWRSMSGMHEVKTQRAMAIARDLWLAREELAVKLDVSPGRLIPDSSIVAVAVNPVASRSALADSKKFIGRASRTYLDTWWAALSSALETKNLPALKLAHTGIPNHRSWPQRFPEADARLTAMKPVMQTLSESMSIPVENLLTPDFLRALAWQTPEKIDSNAIADSLLQFGARKWQVELCSEKLANALLSTQGEATKSQPEK